MSALTLWRFAQYMPAHSFKVRTYTVTDAGADSCLAMYHPESTLYSVLYLMQVHRAICGIQYGYDVVCGCHHARSLILRKLDSTGL
jgi:hypothetical protein